MLWFRRDSIRLILDGNICENELYCTTRPKLSQTKSKGERDLGESSALPIVSALQPFLETCTLGVQPFIIHILVIHTLVHKQTPT